jgi:hypothetical protein
MPHRSAHNYLTINSRPDLEKFTGQLEKQRIIGVDLEADSMYHFKEKVCLIQIATQHATAVIDPLRIKNLSKYFTGRIMMSARFIAISKLTSTIFLTPSWHAGFWALKQAGWMRC